MSDDPNGIYANLNDTDLIKWLTDPEEVKELLESEGRRIVICS